MRFPCRQVVPRSVYPSLSLMAASASASAFASWHVKAYTVSDLLIFHRKSLYSEPMGRTARWCHWAVPGSVHPLHASPRLPAAAAAGLRGSAPQLCRAGGADGSVPANSFLI